MKLWTVQPWSVWLYLKKHGTFFANENLSRSIYTKGHKLDTDFLNAYHWMAKQMAKKSHQRLRMLRHQFGVGTRKVPTVVPLILIILIKLVLN